MKHLLEIAYLGTHYCGFQVQPNGETIQHTVGIAAEKIFASSVLITGCSRTDSGVHANQYFLTVEENGGSSISETAVPRAMNTYLPKDIAVLSSEKVTDSYSIRREVSGKEYLYLIWNGTIRNPFYGDRALFYYRKLNVPLMQEACKLFIGTHDFKAFMASGSDVIDTVRTINDLHLECDGSFTKILISADGFLYNMVRIIVGTLLELSEGHLTLDDIKQAIRSGKRECAGRTAAPEGLYLNRVFLSSSATEEKP